MKHCILIMLLTLALAALSGSPVGAIQTPSGTPDHCSNPGAAAAADALAAKFDDHQFTLIGSTHGDAKIEAAGQLVALDSFSLVEFVVELESSTKKTIPLERLRLESFRSIDAVVGILATL